MMILHRAWSKYKEDGFISLSRAVGSILIDKTLRLFRLMTPVKRYAVWNGVKVPPEVRPKRRLFDEYITLIQTDYNESEDGEVKSHREFTQPGDTVVIIGGGRGVTTVHAARESSPNGQVIVFEASRYWSKIVENVIELNDVKQSCEIRNALVGSNVNVYADGEYSKSIHPQELPECDVLEMDCEGAELGIIKNLNIRPRVVIMEVHPQQYEQAPEAINELADIGYNIVSYRSNEGKKLQKTQFNKEIERRSRGEVGAPIAVGINRQSS